MLFKPLGYILLRYFITYSIFKPLGCILLRYFITYSSDYLVRWSSDLLLKCCFTSTKHVGLLQVGAQDIHLNFHTASESADAWSDTLQATWLLCRLPSYPSGLVTLQTTWSDTLQATWLLCRLPGYLSGYLVTLQTASLATPQTSSDYPVKCPSDYLVRYFSDYPVKCSSDYLVTYCSDCSVRSSSEYLCG